MKKMKQLAASIVLGVLATSTFAAQHIANPAIKSTAKLDGSAFVYNYTPYEYKSTATFVPTYYQQVDYIEPYDYFIYDFYYPEYKVCLYIVRTLDYYPIFNNCLTYNDVLEIGPYAKDQNTHEKLWTLKRK